MRISNKTYAIDLDQYVRGSHMQWQSALRERYEESLRGTFLDTMDVLLAMLIGAPAWVVTPENETTDRLFTLLWFDHMMRRVDSAMRHYLIAGVGGIAITPIGIDVLSPVNFFGVPDYFRPHFWLHVKRFEYHQAVQTFGAYKALKEGRFNTSESNVGLLPEPYYNITRAQYAYEAVDVVEVFDGESFKYFVNNKQVGEEVERKEYENYYVMLGDERPSQMAMISAGTVGLPISMLEKVAGLARPMDINIAEELDSITRAIVGLAKRQSLLFVRRAALVDDRMAALLEKNYRVIWVNDNENAVQTTDKPSLADLETARRVLSEQIISRTGVTSYQRGVPAPGINLATEAALLQANANVRVQRLQGEVTQWLGKLADAFRRYLIDLPMERQEPVTVATSEGVFTFGKDLPYGAALQDMLIVPQAGGFTDILQKRQDLLGAMQVAGLAPNRYDIGLIADALLRTYRVDPALVRVQGQPAIPETGGVPIGGEGPTAAGAAGATGQPSEQPVPAGLAALGLQFPTGSQTG